LKTITSGAAPGKNGAAKAATIDDFKNSTAQVNKHE